MFRSIGKQSGESVESVAKKKRKATAGRICSHKNKRNEATKSFSQVTRIRNLQKLSLLQANNILLAQLMNFENMKCCNEADY